MLNKIIRYGLYTLVFLLPIFFLPATVMPIIINKQMLLSVFAFLLFILWMLEIMISGKLKLAWSKISSSVLLLIIVLAASTFFSGAQTQSLWGMNFEPDTLYSFVLYGLVFFLFSNLIEKQDVIKVLYAFLASSGVLSLMFLIQSFIGPIFPWAFTQGAGFNTVGSIQGLGVFLGGMFVLLMGLMNSDLIKKRIKVLMSFLGVLLFLSLFLINSWVAWLGIVFGIGIILWNMINNMGSNIVQNDFKKFILPLFILVFALIFLRFPFSGIVELPGEISLTQGATLDIVEKTLKQSTKNLILGSGPATFSYQHSLLRGIELNFSNFWQVQFEQGSSAFLTFLISFGVLGSLILLKMAFVFLWQGIKKLRRNELKNEQLAVFASGIYALICGLLYAVNLSFMFSLFLMFGLWVSLTGKRKEFLFTQSPQKAFLIMLLGVVFIAGSLMTIYSVSKKYVAALDYAQGIQIINVLGQEEEDVRSIKLSEAIVKINKAAQLDPKDVYFRNLSQAFLIQINQILIDESIEQEQKQVLFQQAVSNIEFSATAGVQANPQNSQNLVHIGSMYENLGILNVEGANDLAILNLEQAKQLDPQSPFIPFNIARVYLAKQELDRAEEEVEKSLELKSDFGLALSLMGEIEKQKEE